MISAPLNMIKFDSVDSTNTYAKALLCSGEPLTPYTVVYAKEQTQGRGRLGRSWHSKEGESLCMSLIIPYVQKPCITLLCALGVCSALNDICENVQIKWPNDIIVGNKKLCGILTEATAHGTVIGIGINLNSTGFPKDIATKATSLRLITGNTFDPVCLAESVASAVFHIAEKHQGELDAEIIEHYTSLCATIGREVSFSGGKGIAAGISEDGSLIVETKNGMEEVRFGEVLVSGIY